MELTIDIRTQAELREVLDLHRNRLSPAAVNALGKAILESGCREPLTGRLFGPDELTPGEGWREGLLAGGHSSRVRAVMRCIEDEIHAAALPSPRIYAAEGLTPFALTMRGLFPRFLGSEYSRDPARREWMFPIPFEDLQALSFADAMFDIVSTNEVLEHVPSIDCALAELHRVLRPGGWHFGTIPFLFFEDVGEVRATLDDSGQIVHHMEPQFHGDPMNEGGVLVFELPGWDLIARARASGFRDAFMRFMISARHGVLSEHIGGVLILCCKK